MEVGDRLNPQRSYRKSFALKGLRQYIIKTNNPSTIGPGELLTVRFPDLKENQVIIPSTTKLTFNISLVGTDVNRTLEGNLGRNAIRKLIVKLEGNEIISTDDYDVLYLYYDCWKCKTESLNAVFQGIVEADGQTENAIKHRINATNKTDVANDITVASIYDNRFCIPLDFEILESSLPLYQYGLGSRLTYELTFADYSDVIKANKPDTTYTISLFNNKNLLIKGESIWHKLLYSQGTRIIGDLYDNEGSIKTWSVLSAEYYLGPESFLSCYSLVKAIPKEWKAILRDSTVTDENPASENVHNKLYSHLSAKFVYKKLISNCFVHPTSQAHLLRKLNLQDVNWQTVYMLPRCCTIDSHTRIFQYKILNNILFLNNRLFKMNIVNSELCSFCEAEPETIIHLLCSCRKVKQLWSSVQQWCSKCFSLPDLSPETAVLGFWKMLEHISMKTSFYSFSKNSCMKSKYSHPRLHCQHFLTISIIFIKLSIK